MKLTSDGDLTELRTDWHEKSANLKTTKWEFWGRSACTETAHWAHWAVLCEEKVSNNTPVENQELVSESAVEKPSYTHLSGNSTLRTIIERWARHKYTTCNGSYPLSKDHHPIYTKGLLYFCGTRHKCGNCDTILYFRESRHARVQKGHVHKHHLQAL